MRLCLFCLWLISLAAPITLHAFDLDAYHTVKTAIPSEIQEAVVGKSIANGYLGVSVDEDASGALRIQEVAPESPAEKSGLKPGDLILALDGKKISSRETLRSIIEGKAIDETLSVTLRSRGQTRDLELSLIPHSQPYQLPEKRVTLGITVGVPDALPGLPVRSTIRSGQAYRAGVRLKDRLISFDAQELGESLSLTDALMQKRPGDSVEIVFHREGKESDQGKAKTVIFKKTITFTEKDLVETIPREEARTLRPWTKPTYRLAVIRVDFLDVKHNPKVTLRDWDTAYFSKGVYHEKSVTGQPVFGSVADYFKEISCGKVEITGKVFDPVAVEKKKLDYNVLRGSNRSLLIEATKAIKQRDGKEVLNGFDGLVFLYAGDRLREVSRGSLLWPHRSTWNIEGKNWNYVVVADGGDEMSNISTLCHETGHLLGLPDLYARPEEPGSEGLGGWCLMSNQSRKGRPQHPSAWCKEQLGWLNPTVIDPRVKQKLILAPIEGSSSECYKIPVRPDGSEYFLLENRKKTGFDASLSSEGLLIWRVLANRPILEESHGIAGPSGPRIVLRSVPWPSEHNDSFTPTSMPSSRSLLGGGFPVYLTNIRRLPDGRIAFWIGYEFE